MIASMVPILSPVFIPMVATIPISVLVLTTDRIKICSCSVAQCGEGLFGKTFAESANIDSWFPEGAGRQ